MTVWGERKERKKSRSFLRKENGLFSRKAIAIGLETLVCLAILERLTYCSRMRERRAGVPGRQVLKVAVQACPRSLVDSPEVLLTGG